jgi:hypothetical protein
MLFAAKSARKFRDKKSDRLLGIKKTQPWLILQATGE